ncbi:hypothetical protein APHAL10511_007679 [Amanita phalloides]|nr:hypothetical protein APHAL10511_007679 [Amanita phalloides]
MFYMSFLKGNPLTTSVHFRPQPPVIVNVRTRLEGEETRTRRVHVREQTQTKEVETSEYYSRVLWLFASVVIVWVKWPISLALLVRPGTKGHMSDGNDGRRIPKNKKKKRVDLSINPIQSQDGAPIRTKSHIGGPGVWASCVRGKEKGAIGELLDLFESLASDMWPEEPGGDETDRPSSDEAGLTKQEELSLEEQIAQELSAMKRRKRESRFVNCQTNTQCVVFISCRPPVDPVELVVRHIQNVKETGITRTRFLHRLVPVSDTCVAHPADIQSLCRKVFEPFFAEHGDRKFTYKIELRIRNHTTLPRMTIIQTVAQCVPEGHTVSLTEPELFILVEVFKNTFGVSVLQGYYALAKFNVMELANVRNMSEVEQEGRMPENKQSGSVDKNKENKENKEE